MPRKPEPATTPTADPGAKPAYVRPAVVWQQEFVALAQTSPPPPVDPCQVPGGSEYCN